MRWGLPPHPVFALSAAPTLPLEAHAKNDIAVFSANASPNTDGAPPTIPTNPPINRLPNQPLRQSANSTLARNRTFFREFPPNQLIHSVLQNYQIGHEIGHGSNHPKGHFQSATPQLNAPLFAAIETDIVGYAEVKPTDGSKWTLLGVNFDSLNNPDGATGLSVQDIKGDFAAFDELQIWNSSKSAYETLVYLDDELASALPGSPSAGFFDGITLSTATIPRGTGVWAKSATVTSVTMSGRVILEDSMPVTGNTGWSLFASRKPVATPVNEFKFSGLSSFDEMQVWSGTGYTTIIYLDETLGFTGAGFYDGVTLSSAVIQPGQGFWIKSSSPVVMQ